MIRKSLFFIGLILALAALYQLFPLVKDYGELADYGKGYVWGNLVILGLGVVCVVLTFPRIKTK